MPPGKAPPAASMDSAQIFAAATEAIKNKNAKEAMDLLAKYVMDPAAPQAAKATAWLQILRDISSDKFVLDQMSRLSDAELRNLEAGSPVHNSLAPELDELITDAYRHNLPETMRRRGMVANAKAKETPDAKTAGPDAKSPPPAKSIEPAQPVPDPLTKPMEFLTSQGLTRRGSQWSL